MANDPSLYDYYKLLNERYDAWYENFDVCPKMQIDGDELDFVADPQNLNKIMKMIETKLAEIRTGKEKGSYQTQRAVVKGDFSEK